MSLVPTITGEPQSIAGINTNILAMDPSDNQALYLGSAKNGLFYTYDNAENWIIGYSLGRIPIKSIMVDPNSKCIIYAASENKLYKSYDCSRNWEEIYFDNNPAVGVSALAIDHYESNNIYFGTSRGELVKSADGGNNWATINRFEAPILKIVVSPHDSRIVFVATRNNGIYRSDNSGKNWQDLGGILAEFNIKEDFKDLIAAESENGRLILATYYGLLESYDYGKNWQKIKLITSEKDASINAIAVSAKNNDIIYYVTHTTFYRSLDGGKSWATKKLPTSRSGWSLVVDPEDDRIVYLGVKDLGDKENQKSEVGVFGI